MLGGRLGGGGGGKRRSKGEPPPHCSCRLSETARSAIAPTVCQLRQRSGQPNCAPQSGQVRRPSSRRAQLAGRQAAGRRIGSRPSLRARINHFCFRPRALIWAGAHLANWRSCQAATSGLLWHIRATQVPPLPLPLLLLPSSPSLDNNFRQLSPPPSARLLLCRPTATGPSSRAKPRLSLSAS